MSSTVVTRRGAQKAKISTRAQQAAEAAEASERRNKFYGRRPNPISLAEAKKRGKLKMEGSALGPDQAGVQLKDIYSNAMSSMELVRGETGLVYDERFAEHRCLWDEGYPECPERFTRVLERCRELGLVDRCKVIEPRMATEEEILTKHTPEQVEILRGTKGSEDLERLEELSSHYDAVFVHPSSYDCSLLACGSTIELVDAVVGGRVQNGMAIIRPPGHHAMKAEYNGYCFFNNVAIAAQHALDRLGLKKILVVDWDIHHGQGTQRMFYDDPRVLYFSIHRYECGKFWPNLRESDFDYVGEGAGLGYNFNVPLNRIGMTNGDYLAIWQQILLPVAMEFQPELVLISAGYDAAYGCPEGQMEITPAFYPHLLTPLMSLAKGRVAVILEGGYCLSSLAEGGALTLKTLLGDPCPLLVEKLQPPCESMQQTILNCMHTHRPFWKNLQLNDTYGLEELNNVNPQPNFHQVVQYYVQPEPQPEPVRYETRNCYPLQSAEEKARIEQRLSMLQIATRLTFPANRVCFVYDELLLEHRNVHEDHPEQPDRIAKIYTRHEEYKLLARMKRLKPRHATTTELCMVHSRQHVNVIRRTVEREEMKQVADQFNSVYFHPKTFECATLAAGSVLQVVDEVLNGQSRSGVCIVRPPGHHAESDMPHGFCIFNNVAIAAQYAIRDHGLKRVLIVDWDVHHGNGTQHIFESDPRVLYISVHRYDNGTFFPKSTDANFDVVGSGSGEGFNVNIPWNKKGMGDQEYSAAFQQIILPVAYEFDPELVLVSAGFDAAIGDPLGGCKVTPEAYGFFTHWLSSLANGRIVVCLEGGYNVNSISHAMALCTKSLLGDPLPMLHLSSRYNGPNAACVETLRNVLSVQEKFWKSLRFYKKLPDFSNISGAEPDLNGAFSRMRLSMSATESSGSSSGSPSSAGSSPVKGKDESDVVPCDGDEQPGPSRKRKTEDPVEAGPSAGRSSTGEKHETLRDFLAANLEALQNEEMFAVVPLRDCPHLKELNPDNIPEAISTKSPCTGCDSAIENWVCLHCFRVHCGRYINEHAMLHSVEADHALALSFSDLSVWCYKCESYIDNPVLYAYKNLVHRDKFDGEELVWSYGSDLFLDVAKPKPGKTKE